MNRAVKWAALSISAWLVASAPASAIADVPTTRAGVAARFASDVEA